jgi:protein N-terminal methyltransferase
MPKHDAAPDGLISHEDGIEYWNSIPSNVNGMLGGFPEVSTIDLAGSKSFVKKLQDSSQASGSFGRGVDCGMQHARVFGKYLGADLVEFQELVLVESPKIS